MVLLMLSLIRAAVIDDDEHDDGDDNDHDHTIRVNAAALLVKRHCCRSYAEHPQTKYLALRILANTTTTPIAILDVRILEP